MKLITMAAFGASLTISSIAMAGGGCIHGADYGDASLAKNEAEQTPLAANVTDPKWLALQKRLALEEEVKAQPIQVPN